MFVRNGTYVWYTPLKCLCVMVHMFVTVHLNVCALCLWVMWFCFHSPSSIFVPQLCYQDMIVKQGLAHLESFAFLFLLHRPSKYLSTKIFWGWKMLAKNNLSRKFLIKKDLVQKQVMLKLCLPKNFSQQKLFAKKNYWSKHLWGFQFLKLKILNRFFLHLFLDSGGPDPWYNFYSVGSL